VLVDTWSGSLRTLLCGVVAVSLLGCAQRARPWAGGPFIRPGQPAIDLGGALPAVTPGTLEGYIRSVRRLAANARMAPRGSLGVTVETWDAELQAALLIVTAAPAPATHRRVAELYARRGILDAAYEHLSRAIQLDRADAAAYDARARILRDAGLPRLALPDATRAAYFAPQSAEAQNTLGTVFQALRKLREAGRAYARAIEIEPGAAYAYSNLCYLHVLQGSARLGLGACEAAVRLDPEARLAQNNLALAYAMNGQWRRSRGQFDRAGDAAAREYNMGVLHLMGRQYTRAAAAFETANQMRPDQRTRARIRQVHDLLERPAPAAEDSTDDRH
jgi:tetratricopeptide (TPR) repeat protein